jgi:hypothetical protein
MLTAMPGLLPDLQHDLAARMPARDPRQRRARLVQPQRRIDLRAQFACIDHPTESLEPLPVGVGAPAVSGPRYSGSMQPLLS